ncbi:MAG: proteasome subunit beta [Promethearchaeota archaeon]
MIDKKVSFQSNFELDIKMVDREQILKEEKKVNNYLKTGTTTVGLVCKDGVCLATDKRATMGLFIASKTAEKLHMIQPHIWMTIAGGVADAQYLIDFIRSETTLYQLKANYKIAVETTANYLSKMMFQNKGNFEVGLLMGGITEREGPKLFDLGGYGSIIPEKFASVGSGSPFAIGVLEARYHEDLTVEEGMDICAAAVRSAVIRDIASGNGIDVVGIKKDSYNRKFYSIKEDPLKAKK